MTTSPSSLDPRAARRARELGTALAEHHGRWLSWNSTMIWPRYRATDILEPIRSRCRPIAEDLGIADDQLEPLARILAAAFLRTWRRLCREARS